MQIKKYQHTPGPITKTYNMNPDYWNELNDEYWKDAGWRLIPSSEFFRSNADDKSRYDQNGELYMPGSNKRVLVDLNNLVVKRSQWEPYYQNKLALNEERKQAARHELNRTLPDVYVSNTGSTTVTDHFANQLFAPTASNVNSDKSFLWQADRQYELSKDKHDMDVKAADDYVHNLGMTQLDKTLMNNLANLSLTLGGTAAAVPFAWMAPVTFAGGMAGGIAGDYLGNWATQHFSNGKYNTWGDAMQDWTNGYIRADNAAITNPGALLGGTIGGAAARPIFNFGKNMFNAGRNYFGNNSRLSFTNANLATTPTTTSGLNLDDDLGEIMGRTRLAMKNTREHYSRGGEWERRMRATGKFTEDEIGLARLQHEDAMNNTYTIIENNLTKTNGGSAGGRWFKILGLNLKGKPVIRPVNNGVVKLHPNRAISPEDYYNIVLHEFGGHNSNVSLGWNSAFESPRTGSILYETAWSAKYPMLAKENAYNLDLLKDGRFTGNAVKYGLKSADPRQRSFFNYLSRPTEIRARAFEEMMTGRPSRSASSRYKLITDADWNAYLAQFLKKGGNLFLQKKNYN